MEGVKKWVARVMLPVVAWVTNSVFLPLFRKLAEYAGADTKRETPAPSYVESSSLINVLLVAAAQDDFLSHFEQEHENAQAMLNACMETLASEPIRVKFEQLFGGLIAKGYAPQEALTRTLANALYLGTFVQKRITA